MLMVDKHEDFAQAPDAEKRRIAEACDTGRDKRDRAEVELAKTFPGVEAGFALEVRPVVTSEEGQQCWRQT